MRLGVDAALVNGEFVAGDVAIAGSDVAEIGLPATGTGLVATAGFVDLQVNGFAGVDFSAADLAGYQQAAAAMVGTGVTTFQPTFITLPWGRYAPALAVASEARPETPGLAGIHLEGPFLSPRRCGAHDSANMIEPTVEQAAQLAAHDVVTWTTIAPEIAGGLEAIRVFVTAGKVVAIGHSDAAAASAHAGFEAGARSVTHLFNAQSPLHHREPGIPGVALDDDRAFLTLIVDGHHLAPEVVRLVFRVAPERAILITDAIAATGRGDGIAILGDRTVSVGGGAARLADSTLAGSVLTMDQAVRNAVETGVTQEAALVAATANPARALGRGTPADLAPGTRADIAVLDPDLTVVRVLRAGVEVYER